MVRIRVAPASRSKSTTSNNRRADTSEETRTWQPLEVAALAVPILLIVVGIFG